MSREVRCRVCNERSDGSHFGIDSCRACAAFFRRTVNLKRVYVCRLGTNNCNISNSVRCMCRSCRFRKCLKCGMLTENVQPKRDSLKYSFERSEASQGNQMQSTSPSDNETKCAVMRPPFSPVEPSTSAFVPVPVLTFQPSVTNVSPVQNLLKRIEEGYRRLNESRRTAELTLSLVPLRNVFSRNPVNEIKMANFDHVTKIHRADIPLVANFLDNTFEAFASLPQQQKASLFWVVFHNFVCHLWGLEGCFRTMRQFPREDKTRIMLTLNSYVDLDKFDVFFQPQKIDNALVKVMKENFSGHVATIEAMRNVSVTDTEFAALIALTLFSEGIEGATPDTMQIIRVMRGRVFHDLHKYYIEDLGVPNYACRLGECMVLLNFIQKIFLDMAEGMELARLYDLFDKDSFMYHFVKS